MRQNIQSNKLIVFSPEVSRVIKEIELEGKPAIALFDTGAYHTYIRKSFLKDVPKRVIKTPYTVALGGKTIEIKELYLVMGRIEGLDFDAESVVSVDKIGKIDGYELDAIIGALTMEKWEIKIDPRNEELDLEGLRRREFTEF